LLVRVETPAIEEANALNILFLAAEADPFAKVGGMGDFVGSLPAVLRRLGVDARLILPGYGFIDHNRHDIRPLFSFQVTVRRGTADVQVYTTVRDGVPVYFIQSWPYFGQEDSVYTVWEWDMPRFIFYNQLVMAAIYEMVRRLDWTPDLLHVNDWHPGLLPFLVHENQNAPLWEEMATMLTVHNLAYQGEYAGGWLWDAGIPGRHHPDLVYQDKADNMLGIAIAYADIITTVSPRYAVEIQYPSMGFGLDGLMRARATDLYGIVNGIDTDRWNPATDPVIASTFDATTLTEKRPPNKKQLQQENGLEVRDDVMLIGLISRLAWQKGIDLALPALRRLLAEAGDVQFIALGTGEDQLEQALGRLGADFGWKARCHLDYNGATAQRIYAGCDLFLMPSHFEPCGTGQMIAMRYGALPLVRETGGLADTVENYDGMRGDYGTGFVFNWEEPNAVLGTLRWALDTFRHRKEVWLRMQRRAMAVDFSWNNSAERYFELYNKAISIKRE
jgi:starch synthase